MKRKQNTSTLVLTLINCRYENMCRARTCHVTALTYCTRTPTADGHAVNTHRVRVLPLLCLVHSLLIYVYVYLDSTQKYI